MGINNDDFEKIFFNLKNCQKQIHKNLQKKVPREKNLPIQKLLESFALCSGAFYHLNLYRIYYDDLFDNSKNNLPFEESWIFLQEIKNFKDFNVKALPQFELIKSEFRSMCIANAAFRLPSAGFLISDIIYQIDKNEQNRTIANQLKNSWKYHNYLRKDGHDWDREELKIKDRNCMEFVEKPDSPKFFLALLVCLRDEYGHSEYHEDHRCRHQMIEKYYQEYIVQAEILFLQDTLELILQLCQCHDQNKINLCKNT